ncbi:MAG: aminoglycoside phosphotransferase family protein [Candidatus Omnitrophota bacterium]
MDNTDQFIKQFGEVAGKGAQAVVYVRDDIAVKVFNVGYLKPFVFYEAMVMTYIEDAGLPTPKIYEVLAVNGQMALKMSRAKGESLDDIMLKDSGKIPAILDKMIDLQRQIHKKSIPAIIGLKQKLKFIITGNSALTFEQKTDLLKLTDTLPEGSGLCHGDFHGRNILYNGKDYTIIDWIDVASGCVLGDVCRTYLIYALEAQYIADLYLEKYCTATGALKRDILCWAPVYAGSLIGQINEKYNKRLLEFLCR